MRECSESEQLTMMEVIKLPVSESLSNLVNLESLKGIWSAFPLVVSALITLPRQESEVLIFFVSSNDSPFVPALHTF